MKSRILFILIGHIYIYNLKIEFHRLATDVIWNCTMHITINIVIIYKHLLSQDDKYFFCSSLRYLEFIELPVP